MNTIGMITAHIFKMIPSLDKYSKSLKASVKQLRIKNSFKLLMT